MVAPVSSGKCSVRENSTSRLVAATRQSQQNREENSLSRVGVPVVIFWLKRRLGHPNTSFFPLSEKIIFQDQSIQERFQLILKTEALWPTVCGVRAARPPLKTTNALILLA